MVANNKTRQAAFKQRMRLAGKKQITIWVTPEEEQSVLALLGKGVSPPPAKTPATAGTGEQQQASPVPRRRKPARKDAES